MTAGLQTGKVRKCLDYDRLRADERRQLAHTELIRELAQPHVQELVCNGLASVIREHPQHTAQCQRLIRLAMGAQ